jgi:hypothetical protein
MAETLIGASALRARLKAVGSARLQYMKTAAAITRGELVRGTVEVGARKTGNTGRSIQVARVTETSAEITGSPVATWIDTGTGIYGPRHHVITPRAKRALSWMGGTFGRGGSLRLTGTPRKGRAGASAGRITVRSVKGMPARPYIAKSVRDAQAKVGDGIAIDVVSAWNKAS